MSKEWWIGSEPVDYDKIRYLDLYPLNQLIVDTARYWAEGSAESDEVKLYLEFKGYKSQITDIFNSNIAGGSLKIYPEKGEDNSLLSIFKKKDKNPCVKLSEFAAWAKDHDFKCHHKILGRAPRHKKSDINLGLDSSPPVSPKETLATSTKPDKKIAKESPPVPVGEKLDADNYEDIISDETILKLMELPLPKMKQQVAILAAEKKKTDAAVMAAAKIGFMFYEEGLQKPTTEKQFVAEYKKYLDKLPELPDTTIKRIYKNLPEGYRASRDGGKAASDQIDLSPIIKASVYAGSIYDTDDVKKLSKLKAELEENEYDLPSDEVLNKIIAAVKDI